MAFVLGQAKGENGVMHSMEGAHILMMYIMLVGTQGLFHTVN